MPKEGMMVSGDCVAIVSGGMDSVTMLYCLVKTKQVSPVVLTFLYGQKHHKEVNLAGFHAEKLNCRHFVVDLSYLIPLFAPSALISADVPMPTAQEVMDDPQPSTYVPNRNMIFLALAVAYAESLQVQDVYYGAQQHDMYGYWDTTPEFLSKLNVVYQLNRKMPATIHAPFVEKSKADILKLGFSLGVDYGQTWSCYQGGKQACGQCPTCAERLAAFDQVGRTDPLPYLPSHF